MKNPKLKNVDAERQETSHLRRCKENATTRSCHRGNVISYLIAELITKANWMEGSNVGIVGLELAIALVL